jgi:hypothetical protein
MIRELDADVIIAIRVIDLALLVALVLHIVRG